SSPAGARRRGSSPRARCGAAWSARPARTPRAAGHRPGWPQSRARRTGRSRSLSGRPSRRAWSCRSWFGGVVARATVDAGRPALVVRHADGDRRRTGSALAVRGLERDVVDAAVPLPRALHAELQGSQDAVGALVARAGAEDGLVLPDGRGPDGERVAFDVGHALDGD